ncbi:hypothetical protein [Tatumella sp. JGM118]|uniref:hypothetical protein n=1 Tax=Tatumella sp. JGM118 TaxID=2799796 RepID=UPI001BAF1E2F|nr:hypothetical protein [Tatumella sp. JGM118]MBS0908116.1 hypothetical protein [Tatumella sp. JGM118]
MRSPLSPPVLVAEKTGAARDMTDNAVTGNLLNGMFAGCPCKNGHPQAPVFHRHLTFRCGGDSEHFSHIQLAHQ